MKFVVDTDIFFYFDGLLSITKFSLDDSFSVGTSLEVRMSIKPRVKTGVIFSVAKENMDYVSFEMVDGDVSIHQSLVQYSGILSQSML